MNGKNAGCGCGCNERKPADGSRIVDRNTALLIAAGASMAANCRPCLVRIVDDLVKAGVPGEAIRGAVQTGQMAKDKPATLMKEEADRLTGTQLSEKAEPGVCPIEAMRSRGFDVRVPLLIAAGSAVAAGCEPCLNSIIPKLIETKVPEADIRRAVEIGQGIKDRVTALIQEAADVLTGTNLSVGPVPEECDPERIHQDADCCV